MKHLPKISIIVPVYNAEKYLHRCVDSILSQTFTDFELLLINDGSKDLSGDICDEYASKDSRIRVFHKENGGASSARNFALNKVLGEWITFCDADDFVYPHWLENFFPIDEEYDLVCQGMRTNKPLAENDKSQGDKDYSVSYSGNMQGLLETLLKSELLGYTFLKLFKNSIIQKNYIHFDESVRLCEDEIFVLQYALFAQKGKSVGDIGYYYFVPNWSSKYKQSLGDNVYRCKITESLCCRLFANNIQSDVVRFYRDLYTFFIISNFYKYPKNEYLNEIRRMHLSDYGCTRLSKHLKWLIVHDGTLLLSWSALYMHALLRKILK